MEDRVGGRGGTMVLGDGGWGGQCSWAFAMYTLAESSAETSAERSQQLVDSETKKKQRSQSTVEAKRARRKQESVQK